MDRSSVMSFTAGAHSIAAGGRRKSLKADSKVDMDRFLTLEQDYLQAKKKEKESEQTIRELSAQLARTEEAAKRVITMRDPSAKGGAAARLLDAERALARTATDAAEAQAIARAERQRSAALKQRVAELQAALDTARRDQRLLARQLGAAESRQATLRRSVTDLQRGSNADNLPRSISAEELPQDITNTEKPVALSRRQTLGTLKASRLEAELVQLREENRQLRHKSSRASAPADAELTALQRQATELEAALATQSGKAAGALQLQKQLQSQVANGKQHVAALERQLADSQRQVSLLEEELQGMRGEHSQAMREVVAYRQSQDRMSADGQQKAALLSATNAELLQRVEQSAKEAHARRTAQLRAEREATQLGIELEHMREALMEKQAVQRHERDSMPSHSLQPGLLGSAFYLSHEGPAWNAPPSVHAGLGLDAPLQELSRPPTAFWPNEPAGPSPGPGPWQSRDSISLHHSAPPDLSWQGAGNAGPGREAAGRGAASRGGSSRPAQLRLLGASAGVRSKQPGAAARRPGIFIPDAYSSLSVGAPLPGAQPGEAPGLQHWRSTPVAQSSHLRGAAGTRPAPSPGPAAGGHGGGGGGEGQPERAGSDDGSSMADSTSTVREVRLAPVCQELPSDMQTWPDAQDIIIIAIEAVALGHELLSHDRIRNIFVMFSFLPDLCHARQQQTAHRPASRGPMRLDFCMAHRVGTAGYARARTELARMLRSDAPLVLPFCLCAQPGPGERLGRQHQLAYAECDLQDVLENGRDLIHHDLPMVNQHDSIVATLTVTLLAARALQDVLSPSRSGSP